VAAPAPGDKPKWEYAELQIRNVRTPAEGDEPARTNQQIRWTTGGDEVEVKSMAELAEKLKLTTIKKEASANAQRLHLLNLLGSEGWELISVGGGTNAFQGPGGAGGAGGAGGPGGGRSAAGTPSSTMLFKRRVQ
jgi:hypothetical protein